MKVKFSFFQKDAKDFQLLLNLLAESQGLPEAFRILSLFEHQFMMLWEARDISIRFYFIRI